MRLAMAACSATGSRTGSTPSPPSLPSASAISWPVTEVIAALSSGSRNLSPARSVASEILGSVQSAGVSPVSSENSLKVRTGSRTICLTMPPLG